jgi:hypothetical protein
MLFKLHYEKSPFVLNDGLQAIREFVCLSDRQFTAVALFVDYDSPLRKLPEIQRREQAAIISGYPMEGKRLDKNGRNFVDGKVKSMESAINKYREIQFDKDKETLAGIDRQIHEIMEIVKEDKIKSATKVTISKEGSRAEFVDQELRYKLVDSATKMAKTLPDLYKSRNEMLDLIGDTENKPELSTFTSSDILDNEEETVDENLSTVDQYMIKHGRRTD